MVKHKTLNDEQIKGLANFFFDMAKALILAAIGLLTIQLSFETKIIVGVTNIYFAFFCLETAIALLDKFKTN